MRSIPSASTAQSSRAMRLINRMIGNPENSDKRADWSQQSNPNAHSPAFVFTNRRIDDEIKGGGNTTVNVV